MGGLGLLHFKLPTVTLTPGLQFVWDSRVHAVAEDEGVRGREGVPRAYGSTRLPSPSGESQEVTAKVQAEEDLGHS